MRGCCVDYVKPIDPEQTSLELTILLTEQLWDDDTRNAIGDFVKKEEEHSPSMKTVIKELGEEMYETLTHPSLLTVAEGEQSPPVIAEAFYLAKAASSTDILKRIGELIEGGGVSQLLLERLGRARPFPGCHPYNTVFVYGYFTSHLSPSVEKSKIYVLGETGGEVAKGYYKARGS